MGRLSELLGMVVTLAFRYRDVHPPYRPRRHDRAVAPTLETDMSDRPHYDAIRDAILDRAQEITPEADQMLERWADSHTAEEWERVGPALLSLVESVLEREYLGGFDHADGFDLYRAVSLRGQRARARQIRVKLADYRSDIAVADFKEADRVAEEIAKLGEPTDLC